MKNIVSIKNIYKSYDEGAVKIIDNISIDIPQNDQGNFITILGPSGCGKSTILRFISGLDSPTSGSVLVNDQDPMSKSIIVGQVFQKYSSFPFYNVLENVGLGLQFAGTKKQERVKKSLEIIEKVGLSGHEHKFAQYPLLSGGQLQRVAIARSLVCNPNILLMDEPFGALDIKTRYQMQNLTLDIMKNFKTNIIFVTHDISEAVFLSNKIYILSSAPATIVKEINIPFTLEQRNLELKKTNEFSTIVNYIDSLMLNIENANK